MIDESVLQKFRDDTCSEAERQEVLQAFKEHPEWLEACMLESDWNKFRMEASKKHDPRFDSLYSNIENTAFSSSNKWTRHIKKAVAAALLAGALIGGGLYLKNSTTDTRPARVTEGSREKTDTTIMNTSDTLANIALSDGSRVKLYPGSSMHYMTGFSATRRDIILNGKGVFRATRDERRPFTVYAGNIATTALGTLFMVSRHKGSGKVDVFLYEGKVAIRKYENDSLSQVIQYLSPGAGYSNMPEVPAPQPLKKTGRPHKMPAVMHSFIFKNTPLKALLDSLSQASGIKFSYRERDIRNMTYTGTYDKEEQTVDALLTTIGLLNGFAIEKKDSTHYIINIK